MSKTVQNEILDIAAGQICEFYSECYRKSPNFSVIADEVTSHGKEILAVCLRFLEISHTNGQTKPKNIKLYSIFFF